MKTLELRVRQQNTTALKLARALEASPKVTFGLSLCLSSVVLLGLIRTCAVEREISKGRDLCCAEPSLPKFRV